VSWDFKRIRQVADDACDEARETEGPWRDEAVNWGDLGVAAFEWCGDVSEAPRVRVVIEEASGSCWALQGFVYNKLVDAGLGDGIEVVTEW